MKKLLLIDGMAAVYRAYYALNKNPRVNSKGLNTSCILGFTTTLYDLLRSQRPTHVGVAFDLPKPTFRHEMYADYKANREAMPEEIQQGLPWVKKMIDAFRIPILTCEGFEADDVIGTLSHLAEQAAFDEVVMVTPDKDFAQLVTPTVKIYRFGRMGRPDSIMGIDEVKEKFGVSNPRQVIDLLGLWGDASDNIPGIPGVGEKTAKKLIDQFGSIEQMVAHADEIKNEKMRLLVHEHAEQALFSKHLATIRLDAPIAFEEEKLQLEEPDYQQLKAITDELEFRQFAKKVFTDLTVKDPAKAVAWGNTNATNTPHKTIAPTLFDLAPSSNQAPLVHQAALSAEVLDGLCNKDVAILVDGPNFVLSTDADSVWLAKVADIDIPRLARVLNNPSTIKLCFDLKNLKYILAELDITLCGEIFDVQLAHYLIDAEMRHTLDFICSAILGFEPEGRIAQAAALWQLYPLMVARLKDEQLEKLYRDVELPLVDVLIDMEKEGVRIDVDALRQYSRQLTAERTAIEEKIYSLAGESFNISSPKQLGEVLYEKLKVTSKPPLTPTKQYSTAEDVLTKLAPSHPIIPLILDYRSISKLVGTYLDSFPRLINPATGRLHTVYNQTVTATGRLSSSNPNLQNIPVRTERGKRIREAFVARDENHLLMSADYSQIELRLVAALSGDKAMLEAFAQGADIHTETAARVYGVMPGLVTSEMRSKCKMVNFGIIYGISAFGLSQRLGVPRKEAADLIASYFREYPGIKAYMEKAVADAREKGYAETVLGRRRTLRDISSRNATVRQAAERNAINTPVQGSAADLIKIAMVRVHRALRAAGLKTKLVLQIHDELLLDMPREEEEPVRAIVRDAMVNALDFGVPLEVEIGVGRTWLEAH